MDAPGVRRVTSPIMSFTNEECVRFERRWEEGYDLDHWTTTSGITTGLGSTILTATLKQKVQWTRLLILFQPRIPQDALAQTRRMCRGMRGQTTKEVQEVSVK